MAITGRLSRRRKRCAGTFGQTAQDPAHRSKALPARKIMPAPAFTLPAGNRCERTTAFDTCAPESGHRRGRELSKTNLHAKICDTQSTASHSVRH